MIKKVKLVSMVHTSNLDGYTIPAKEIIKISRDYGALVLLDGTQSVPHKPINVQQLDADFLVFSIHKMLGPILGVLYGKNHLLKGLKPLSVGGGSVKNTTYTSFELSSLPKKFEGGLQNYASIIAAGIAVDYLTKIGKENVEIHEHQLNKMITNGLMGIKGVEIIGPRTRS